MHEQQTHSISRAEHELDICARRLNLVDRAALHVRLNAERSRVHEIYSSVLERRPGTSDFRSRQFFRVLIEEASDAEALELVGEHGLPDSAVALNVIRALDQATSFSPSRSVARNVLANLLAALLDQIGRCARPQQVLIRLEQITERSGSAGSFYKTLLEDEALRNLLVSMLDLGDLPAARLIRYPELLDSLLFTLSGLDELRTHYVATLEGFEPAKRRDQIRRFKAIEEFKILVEWVGDGSLETLQERLSLLADCCIRQAAAWTEPAPGGMNGTWLSMKLNGTK